MEEHLRPQSRRGGITHDAMLAALESYIEVCRRRFDVFAEQGAQFACRREARRLNRAIMHLRTLQASGHRRPI
ncbi:MAG: hypothetical protein AB1489_08350 [Acidobacteriota bacterium]